ncbi:mannonate dehydratase [Martelella mediterranea]|uniref:mannonate dehydratase n=1 Tax=Martelella mediterranea TaxID=293089 RepID=A0A4V6P063_9HYPH|nr:mannonate dehydratase [Martelella mediterranea]TCT33004.1 D-mannonate dehydratase [Martelella mediterranea]
MSVSKPGEAEVSEITLREQKMRVGLTLFGESLSPAGSRFAAQLGIRDVVIHLVRYGHNADPSGWLAGQPGPPLSEDADAPLWDYETLSDVVKMLAADGIRIAALENFSPSFWSDILLNGPRRVAQMDRLKRLVRDCGRVGIPVIGYNFSLAGVWGWQRRPIARGGAVATTFDMSRFDHDRPMPDGVVWNMRVREDRGDGHVSCSDQELWQRLEWFLKELVPVAEESGVKLAAHPDDPPADNLRGTPRLVNRHEKYDRLLSIIDSPSNAMQFCIGSLMEMPGDIYETTRHYARTRRIAYVHFRNVKGKVPRYAEAFIDDGDTNMAEIARILHAEGYDGVLVPDHIPEISCPAPWHVGMAHAVGYMNALLKTAPRLTKPQMS